MDKKQEKAAERKELNTLLNKGVSIELERIVTPKGRFGFLKKKQKAKEKLSFNLKEPTLSVLDYMASEQIEIDIDEESMKGLDAISSARTMSHKHARRAAKLVSIAVLGEDCFKQVKRAGRTAYVSNDKKINELTDLFFHNVKPSQLLHYAMLISTISNLGDFMNSIRLMSANRTTMPTLIEGNSEG